MSRLVKSLHNLSLKSNNAWIASALKQYSQATFAHETDHELILKRLDGNDAGITIMGLNRPKARNAFSMNLVEKIHYALDALAVDSSVRVLVLTSAATGMFCAGADLKERATMSAPQVASFVASLRLMMSKYHELPVPVIAAIDGLALGGGLELALACDIRVAASVAKMGLVETRLAIMPGAGGTQRLPRLINPAIAKELIYTARIFDGDEARALGVVNHSVAQNAAGDAALQRALEIAREMLHNGPFALKMAKAAINRGLEVDLQSALRFEEAYYAQIIPTRDRVEGLTAFKEKRAPKYIGE